MAPTHLWKSHLNGQNQDNAVRRLARRLHSGDLNNYPDGGNSNIFILSLIAEADKRGRNPNGNIPLPRNPEIEAWQRWLIEKSEELNLSKQPEMLLKGKTLLDNYNIDKGPILGILLRCVYLDQLDGRVENVDQAILLALDYLQKFKEVIERDLKNPNNTKKDNYNYWKAVDRLKDPRILIKIDRD
jgi:hypothetical protein